MKKDTPLDQINGRNEVKLAVMTEKITNIEASVADMKIKQDKDASEIKNSIQNLQHSIDDGYAKKTELDATRTELKEVQSQISWAIKLVIGLVITAVVGLVLVNK